MDAAAPKTSSEGSACQLGEIKITREMIAAGISYLASVRAFAEPMPGSDEEVGAVAAGLFRAMTSAGKAPKRHP